jgi:hypothetical protein
VGEQQRFKEGKCMEYAKQNFAKGKVQKTRKRITITAWQCDDREWRISDLNI